MQPATSTPPNGSDHFNICSQGVKLLFLLVLQNKLISSIFGNVPMILRRMLLFMAILVPFSFRTPESTRRVQFSDATLGLHHFQQHARYDFPESELPDSGCFRYLGI